MSTRRSFTLPETSPTQRTAVGESILIGRDAGYTQPVATPEGYRWHLLRISRSLNYLSSSPNSPCPSPPSITTK